MLVLLGFAFVSGIITILSPCILPVLPIVLSGSVGGGKARPFGVLAGFVVSFTVFTLTLSAIVRALRIPTDALRVVAVVLIGLFGIVMLVPKLRDWFEILTSRIASRGSTTSSVTTGKSPGFWSGLVVGVSLGLVWTPCVGPIMASVISLALTQQVGGASVLITLAYTLGTSIPMLAVMLGGRALLARVPALTRNTANIQKGFGVLMIVMAVAIGFGWDRRFQAAILSAFPNYGAGLTAIEKAPSVHTALKALQPARAAARVAQTNAAGERLFSGAMDATPQNGVLGDYGLAPGFVTKGMWFNTQGVVPMEGQPAGGGAPPLTMKSLRGRVVLIDFWTYSCVNCVRTLPYLRAWYGTYRKSGLVIVGVHTPEFEFEMKSSNVAQAIKDLGVTWPVVQDNDYKEWNAYSNQYWPAHYFIDAKGHVRYFHFGEGDYKTSEKVIQELLKEAGANVSGLVSKPAPSIEAHTNETYLGYDRGRGFASATKPVPDKPAAYTPAKVPGNGEWNLQGTWTITPQYVVPQTSGTLQLGFNAKNVFLVIQPDQAGGTIDVSVDGKPAGDTPDVRDGVLSPRESRMYQLVGLKQAGPHLLRLEVHGKVRLFAFTFG